MTDRRIRRAGVALAAVLLAGCATVPSSSPEPEITLQYLDGDYVAYRVDANAQGSYEQRRFDEVVYLTRQLDIDEDKLEAFAKIVEESHFFTLPHNLDDLPDPERADCNPDLVDDPGCAQLEVIVVTSDCGPDSRLRISDGRRSREVHWSCETDKGEHAIAPLLDAVRGLFADQPTVQNAPPVHGWRR